VHLRRALLLFAIVLGLAALAASLSASRRHDGASTTPTPPGVGLRAGPARVAPLTIRFRATSRPHSERLPPGRAATVSVRVPEPGDVELAGLGLSAAAEPLTPARFDVLAPRGGRYDVRFTPARGGETRTIGVLRVLPPPF
jgi:hypothetical protein